MSKLLKLIFVDIVEGGIIRVNMMDDDNNKYRAFFEPDRFFDYLGFAMCLSHKEWTAKENLRKFTYTKDYKEEEG